MFKIPRTLAALLFCVLAMPAVSTANEIWVTPGDTLASRNIGDWATTRQGKTRFSFAIPDNMTAFLGAKVAIIPTKTMDITYNLYLSVSSDGESHRGFEDEQLRIPVSMVKGEMLEIDVSSIFPLGMFPGADYVSLVFRPKNKADYVKVVGLRFQYEGPAGPPGPPGPPGQSPVYKAGLRIFPSVDPIGKILLCNEGDKLIQYDFDSCPFPRILIRSTINSNGVEQSLFTCSLLGDDLMPGGGWGLCMDF
jgi:hypothetical protein